MPSFSVIFIISSIFSKFFRIGSDRLSNHHRIDTT
nr:MAG TPA: hypothetical protein [Caudoviricetes sp.]